MVEIKTGAPTASGSNLQGPAIEIVCAALLGTAVLRLLQVVVRETSSDRAKFDERVELLERRHQEDRERLHELNASIAGIAKASHLIHDEPGISVERRACLERMVESELDRLEHMGRPEISRISEVDLDDTIGPVVMAQRCLGRTVHWTPTGHVVMGRREHVAEVLTTLLENAARHACGSPVWIRVQDDETDLVELEVKDVGPGIAPEVRRTLFEWGKPGAASPGEGIGLNIARRVMEDLGGSLHHVPTGDRGARFQLRLPQGRCGYGVVAVSA